jgi:uncharacterized protein Yka (UPF0111/DUF47 family)
MKAKILETLGEAEILLPSLIAAGLTANERVKARLGVLQAVGLHARDPARPLDLTAECRTAGIPAMPMEALVREARLGADGIVSAPGLGHLTTAIQTDVATMIEPVRASSAAEGAAFTARLDAIAAATHLPDIGDSLKLALVGRLTGLDDSDSLHRLVMDLHKALNRLAIEHAEEDFAGAKVHGLLPGDRAPVEAFMRGLARTRGLKFNHPGLDTTATRIGDRLVIQNDIGETDAHVVVVTVQDDVSTVTYTDLHRNRAAFFTTLFRDLPVTWSGLDRRSAAGLEDEEFYLVTGRHEGPSAARETFLERLGASLVFLIDWNKARKLLRTWVAKADAVQILDWAARNEVGHRAFMELGGAELVAAAVNHAAPARIGFGERLDHALGREATIDFLKSALRISTVSLRAGGSARRARDGLEAELMRHLERADGALLAIVIRQAGLAREIAAGIAGVLGACGAQQAHDAASLAARARHIEEKADRIAVDARAEIARIGTDQTIEGLVNGMEAAIDELEQAAFLASLLPDAPPPELLALLNALCRATIAGAEAAAMGIAAASDIPEGQRIDSEEALAAVTRLADAEHEADDAERAVTATVLRGQLDFRPALAILELARALENATDRLAGFGHLLRARVLADLSA